MTNKKVNAPAEGKVRQERPNTQKKLFFGLFVFPLLIAVGMAVLLSVIVFLTKEEETPESLIKSIKTGAPSKRWQKAFELSNELNHQSGMIRSAGIMKEIIHVLNDKDHYDAKTRAYMAMALGRFHNEEALTALRGALKQVDEAEDPEVPLFLMWTIGNFEKPELAQDVAPFLESKQSDLRKTAAYVLGVLGNREYRAKLRPLLEDPVHDVRWNSALSLARLSDGVGWEVLMKMLDRNYLRSEHQLNDSQIAPIMINAAKGFTLIRRGEAVAALEKVASEDQNLKVREAALRALQYQRQILQDSHCLMGITRIYGIGTYSIVSLD